MSRPPLSPGEPITDPRQLVSYLESGCKPKERWRIGTEHEKLAYRRSDLKRLPYDGPDGIGALLKGLTDYDWEPVLEGDAIIALSKGACAITLEPGGQLELSGAPVETIHETCSEVHSHLAEAKAVTKALGAGLIGLGFDPKWRREDIGWMPKGRYKIMRDYMPKVGSRGLDMMLRTCTVQVNLDFPDEATMVRMFRIGIALQPVATALFANSPFEEGKPSGLLSLRSHVWTDTDPDRCGILPFVFEDGMGFERYTEHVLDVPMYFVYRDGRYIDTAGRSFRDFLAGKLPELPGELPTLGDWDSHLTTLFPEVRLKRYMEMRGADGGPWRRLCALPALWVGLLYDETARDSAWDLVKDMTEEERLRLRDEVPRFGLKTAYRDGTVGSLALEVLKIAEAGLKARRRLEPNGKDETQYLETLWQIAESGRTPAEELLEKFEGPWQGSVDPVFREYAY